MRPIISDDWQAFRNQMSKEKTFVIERDDREGGWKCPDLQTQFTLFSKFANSGSDGIQITLRKVFDDLHYSIQFQEAINFMANFNQIKKRRDQSASPMGVGWSQSFLATIKC